MHDTFEYDAVQHFVNKVEVNWRKHYTNLSCDCHVQMTLLTEAQIEATEAENKIVNLQVIAQ